MDDKTEQILSGDSDLSCPVAVPSGSDTDEGVFRHFRLDLYNVLIRYELLLEHRYRVLYRYALTSRLHICLIDSSSVHFLDLLCRGLQ